MNRDEIKSKIAKVITIALPIVLVAILAMLVVVAMDIPQNDGSVPAINDSIDTTTTTAEKEDDEPIPDPSSVGLLFVSFGDGTCTLEGIGECTDTFVIVPTISPDGDIVTQISDGAFKNSNAIRGIELPSTLKEIGAYAFYGAAIKEIFIPSGVGEIGNYAFSGCKYLENIEVDENNKTYSSLSGALYSKDGKTLITYPAGKGENFVNISRDVTTISNMAFYRCSSIKKVNYHGTSASWKSVEIGAGNEVIDEAFIFYAGDSGK